MNPETRAAIAEAGISVWLRADLDVLMRRVRKRSNRPLLQNPDPGRHHAPADRRPAIPSMRWPT